MCCFSGPVTSVTDTRIFARALPDQRQALIYSMSLDTPKDEVSRALGCRSWDSRGGSVVKDWTRSSRTWGVAVSLLLVILTLVAVAVLLLWLGQSATR